MSGDEIREGVDELRRELRRIEAIEAGNAEDIADLSATVAEVKGMVTALQAMVIARFNGVDKGVKEATPGWDTALKFGSLIVLPLLLAILSTYVALKSGVKVDTSGR